MPQLVIYRRDFAGVPVTVTTVDPLLEPDQQRRIVARGRISRNGGHITISGRFTGPVVNAAGR
jgi:hypothetical protein